MSQEHQHINKVIVLVETADGFADGVGGGVKWHERLQSLEEAGQ